MTLLFIILVVATIVAGAMVERRWVPLHRRWSRIAIVLGAALGGMMISMLTRDGWQFALLGSAFSLIFGMSWAGSAASSVSRNESTSG